MIKYEDQNITNRPGGDGEIDFANIAYGEDSAGQLTFYYVKEGKQMRYEKVRKDNILFLRMAQKELKAFSALIDTNERVNYSKYYVHLLTQKKEIKGGFYFRSDEPSGVVDIDLIN